MSETQINPQEIRDAFAKIAERYRDGHEAIAPIRVRIAKDAQDYIEVLETRAANCSCPPPVNFKINPRNKRIDYDFQMRRLHRMRAEDAVIEEVLFAEQSQ